MHVHACLTTPRALSWWPGAGARWTWAAPSPSTPLAPPTAWPPLPSCRRRARARTTPRTVSRVLWEVGWAGRPFAIMFWRAHLGFPPSLTGRQAPPTGPTWWPCWAPCSSSSTGAKAGGGCGRRRQEGGKQASKKIAPTAPLLFTSYPPLLQAVVQRRAGRRGRQRGRCRRCATRNVCAEHRAVAAGRRAGRLRHFSGCGWQTGHGEARGLGAGKEEGRVPVHRHDACMQ